MHFSVSSQKKNSKFSKKKSQDVSHSVSEFSANDDDDDDEKKSHENEKRKYA